MLSENRSFYKAALCASLLTLLFSLGLCFLLPMLPDLLLQAVWSGSVFLPCLLLSLLVGLLVWLNLSLRALREDCAAMQLSIDQALRQIDGLKAELKKQQEKGAP